MPPVYRISRRSTLGVVGARPANHHLSFPPKPTRRPRAGLANAPPAAYMHPMPPRKRTAAERKLMDENPIPLTELEVKGEHWYGLTKREARLAAAYVVCGGVMAEAARRVKHGYREAKRLLAENQDFQAAVSEFLHALTLHDAVRARGILVALMHSESSTDKTKLEAAKLLYDRGLGKSVQVHEHQHRFGEKPTAELEALAQALIGRLGITGPDPHTRVIEGAYTNVNEDADSGADPDAHPNANANDDG